MHIGINTESPESSEETAALLGKMFGLSTRPGVNSNFVSDIFEITRRPLRGEKGHIGMWTNSVEQAMAYLTALGFSFAQDSLKYDSEGNIRTVYLQEEIGGFAFHFNRKAE